MTKVFYSKRFILLLVLFISAFALRFLFINKGPFHYDTLDLAISAQETLDTHVLHYEHGTGYPLTVICAALTIFILKFFGVVDPVFCVNFMSVLTGSLSVIFLFSLTEKLFDFDRAFCSAFLLVFFMPHLAISTFGKSLTLGICLSLCSAYYMLLYTETFKKRYLVYSALFLGFCAAARLSDVLVFLPIAFLYFSHSKMSYGKLKGFIVFVIISSVAALIYYAPMLLERGLNQFREVWQSSGGAQFVGIFSEVFKYNLFWMAEIFSVGGAMLFIAGFGYMLIRRLIRPFLFLVIWFLVMFIFYAGISSSGPRYLVIAWLPLIIAQGYFLGDFKEKRIVLSLALFVTVSINFITYAPTLAYRHQFSLQQEFAEWVNRKTPADALIIAMDESIFIKYYAHRKILSRPIFEDKKQIAAFFREIDDLLKDGKNVYIISTAYLSYDATNSFKKSLFNRYSMVFLGKRVNEDWHFSLLDQLFLKEKLYRIMKKDE